MHIAHLDFYVVCFNSNVHRRFFLSVLLLGVVIGETVGLLLEKMMHHNKNTRAKTNLKHSVLNTACFILFWL